MTNDNNEKHEISVSRRSFIKNTGMVAGGVIMGADPQTSAVNNYL